MNYLVFTKTFGIIRKSDDNIKAARQWAKKAFHAGEVVGVQREHSTGTPVADLETEWREIVSRRWPCSA